MKETKIGGNVGGEQFGVDLIDGVPRRLQQQTVELAGIEFMEKVEIDDKITCAYYEGGEDILMLGYLGLELRCISHVVITEKGFIYRHYTYNGKGWRVNRGEVEGLADLGTHDWVF